MAKGFHPAVRRGAGISAVALLLGVTGALIRGPVGVLLIVLMAVGIVASIVVMIVGTARG
jgi:hypothetical protein